MSELWYKPAHLLANLHEAERKLGLLAPKELPMPAAVADWLARLRLLYGVPFVYLVPDPRLLPRESLRCFYLDRNWVDRLVDGALSVGKAFSHDYAQHERHYKTMRDALDSNVLSIRLARSGGTAAPRPVEVTTSDRADKDAITGILLRSAAVAIWQGLEVRALRGGKRLELLRMDRLAPEVLLCLFGGVPTRIEFHEPSESLRFGFERYWTRQAQAGPGGRLQFVMVESYQCMPADLTPRRAAGSDHDTLGARSAAYKSVPFRDQERLVVDVRKLGTMLGCEDSARLALHLSRPPAIVSLTDETRGGGAGAAPAPARAVAGTLYARATVMLGTDERDALAQRFVLEGHR